MEDDTRSMTSMLDELSDSYDSDDAWDVSTFWDTSELANWTAYIQSPEVSKTGLEEIIVKLDDMISNTDMINDKNSSRRLRTIITVKHMLQTYCLKMEEDVLMRHDSTDTVEINESSESKTIDECDTTLEIRSEVQREGDEIDSFAESRMKAINSTIISESRDLPSFSDISGLNEVKSVLIEALVDPMKYASWFEKVELRPWKALLLYGPPGTGKSVIAQATVKEMGALLYQVSSSDLISSWSGQSERLIRELFSQASRHSSTVVVFIDEVDSLCRQRSAEEGDANRRVKTELLVQMQKLHTTKQVILVCATNCPWDLDSAFLRRFEKKVYVGLPDELARIEICQKRLKNITLEDDLSWEWIGENTEGLSGDDLRRLCLELTYAQFRRYKRCLVEGTGMDAEMNNVLSKIDFLDVMRRFVRSVDDQQLRKFEEYSRR